jgi:hypothetical protein
VVFEAKHVFGGPEDAFDALAQRCEVGPAARFVFSAGSDDVGAQFGGVGWKSQPA